MMLIGDEYFPFAPADRPVPHNLKHSAAPAMTKLSLLRLNFGKKTPMGNYLMFCSATCLLPTQGSSS